MPASLLLAVVLFLGAAPASFALEGIDPGVKFNPAEGTGHEAYEQGLDKRNRQERQEAADEGESHMDVLPGVVGERPRDAVKPPEVISRPRKKEADPDEAAPETIPVEGGEPRREWRPEQAPGYAAGTGEDEGNLDAIVAALVEAFNRPPDIRRIAYGEPEGELRSGGGARVPVRKAPLPRVGAGDAFYARVMHAVNSDYPGPVLIELLQPPLAGAVARGEFQLVRERMVIRLASLDIGGETVAVDAVAVGLDCACFGVAGDVSYHWWERVLLPAATGFVEQYLIARAEPERRIVTTDGGTVVTDEEQRSARQARDAGLAAAAGRVGEVLLEQAPARQTVEIPRNAEVAVMFAERLARASAAPEAAAVTAPAPPRVERVERVGRAGPGDEEVR